MLEKFVPSSYVNGAKELLDSSGLFSAKRDPILDGVETSSFRRFSDDSSDEDDNYSALPSPTSENNSSIASSSLRPRSSGASSHMTGDFSDGLMESESADSDDEDENGDYDEDDDDYSGFDGFNDEDAFEPIRGLKPASRPAYREFRRAFTAEDVPANEVLYKAYSCALCKEILYQGKMFVTTHYVCFISKIFNVTTHKIIMPFSSITKIEPKMMMNFIPNSIAIRTNDDKRYTFASFTNRNRTMGFLRKLRNSRLVSSSFSARSGAGSSSGGTVNDAGHDRGQGLSDDSNGNAIKPVPSRVRSSTLPASPGGAGGSGQDPRATADFSVINGHGALTPQGHGSGENMSLEGRTLVAKRPSTVRTHSADNRMSSRSPSRSPSGSAAGGLNAGAGEAGWPVSNLGPSQHPKTAMPEPEESEKVLATETIDAPIGVVANILFGIDTSWYKHFLADVERNKDLNDIAPFPELKTGSERSFEYVKPLHGPMGPKQTKCNCTEKIEHWDLDHYVEVITTTVTPDVPSGSSFKTLTRAVLSWDDNNATVIRLGTWLEWTGKTWLKGPIEKGAIDGQTSYCKDLVSELSKKVSRGAKSEAAEKAAPEFKPADAESEKESSSKTKQVRKSSTAKRAAQAIKEWQQLCIILAVIIAILLIMLFITWRRSRRSSAALSKEQEFDLFKIQQELELWQWIDDRRDPTSVHRHNSLSDANIAEAIAFTEKKLANIKASLS